MATVLYGLGYNYDRQSFRNQDIIKYINRLCHCYSFGYSSNTSVTTLSANTPTPFALPNVTPVEIQQGSEWTHSATNGRDEWTYNGPNMELKELTFTFELLNANGGGIASASVFIYEDGVEKQGWEVRMPLVSGTSTASLTGTLFLPMKNTGVYSLWLRNNDNNDDIRVTNLRVTCRPIPQFYPNE